jgi:hypothetical protein
LAEALKHLDDDALLVQAGEEAVNGMWEAQPVASAICGPLEPSLQRTMVRTRPRLLCLAVSRASIEAATAVSLVPGWD